MNFTKQSKNKMLTIIHINKNKTTFALQFCEKLKLESHFKIFIGDMYKSFTVIEILEIIENKEYEIWVDDITKIIF